MAADVQAAGDGPPPSPPDNPLTADKIALGARLFADARLSGKGDRSCASCHRPERAFTDGRRRALALSGAPLRRNTPSLWNLAWGKHFFWDGRAPSLETQVGMPIEEPQEMGGDWPTILRRLEGDDELVAPVPRGLSRRSPRFREATILKALAAYVRSLVSPPTRFDAWIDGDAQRAAPRRGARLRPVRRQGRLRAVPRGLALHRRSLPRHRPAEPAMAAAARCRAARRACSAFKTPGLRELAHTAPYMHDGSLATLEAVVAALHRRLRGAAVAGDAHQPQAAA